MLNLLQPEIHMFPYLNTIIFTPTPARYAEPAGPPAARGRQGRAGDFHAPHPVRLQPRPPVLPVLGARAHVCLLASHLRLQGTHTPADRTLQVYPGSILFLYSALVCASYSIPSNSKLGVPAGRSARGSRAPAYRSCRTSTCPGRRRSTATGSPPSTTTSTCAWTATTFPGSYF